MLGWKREPGKGGTLSTLSTAELGVGLDLETLHLCCAVGAAMGERSIACQAIECQAGDRQGRLPSEGTLA